MIESLDTDAVLYYSLSLICRVIFCWLSRHSRSLFSVLVRLCSKLKSGSMNMKISPQHQKCRKKVKYH